MHARQVVTGPVLHLRAVEAGDVRDRRVEAAHCRSVGLGHGPVRQVRLAEVQEQGEGPVAALGHEADGLVGHQVRQRAFQGLLAALHLERGVHRGVPAVEEAEEALEAEGRGRRAPSDVPLPDERRAPPALAKDRGPGRSARRKAEARRPFLG